MSFLNLGAVRLAAATELAEKGQPRPVANFFPGLYRSKDHANFRASIPDEK